MQTLILSVIAINQLVGPVLGRMALARAGEIGMAEDEEETEAGQSESGAPKRQSQSVSDT